MRVSRATQLSEDHRAALARAEAATADAAGLRREATTVTERCRALSAECDARAAALGEPDREGHLPSRMKGVSFDLLQVSCVQCVPHGHSKV